MFDLDDFRSQVGHQLGRVRKRLHLLGGEDANTLEGLAQLSSLLVDGLADAHARSIGVARRVGFGPLSSPDPTRIAALAGRRSPLFWRSPLFL